MIVRHVVHEDNHAQVSTLHVLTQKTYSTFRLQFVLMQESNEAQVFKFDFMLIQFLACEVCDDDLLILMILDQMAHNREINLVL